MSLVGSRPKSADDLPRKPPVRLSRAGDCYRCGATLKTDLDARMHFCWTRRQARGDRETRVRL